MVQVGIGNQAQLVSEDDAKQSDFPKFELSKEYKVGVGDTLSFINLIENQPPSISSNEAWIRLKKDRVLDTYKVGLGDTLTFLNLVENSNQSTSSNRTRITKDYDQPYIVGIGDEITLIQLNDDIINPPRGSSFSLGDEANNRSAPGFESANNTNNIIQTSGRVGSDGSLLLLEVGRLESSGKTINELRSEVRNILIRNGLSPKFQLDITDFKSQKAYLSLSSNASGESSGSGEVLPITDQPLKLREVLSQAGISKKPGVKATVTLQRSQTKYSFGLDEIYAVAAPDIILKDQDHIFIRENIPSVNETQVSVGQDGSIILPSLGKINVSGKTIAAIEKEVKNLSARKNLDYWKQFQLDITDFKSQKAYLSLSSNASGESSGSGEVLPITDQPLKLRGSSFTSRYFKKTWRKSNCHPAALTN